MFVAFVIRRPFVSGPDAVYAFEEDRPTVIAEYPYPILLVPDPMSPEPARKLLLWIAIEDSPVQIGYGDVPVGRAESKQARPLCSLDRNCQHVFAAR